MPKCADADILVRLEGGEQFVGFPIPDKQLAIGVARDEVAVMEKG